MYLIFIVGLVVSLLWISARLWNKNWEIISQKTVGYVAWGTGCYRYHLLFVMGLFMKVWIFIPFDQYGLMGQLSVSLMGTVATIMGGYGLIKARLVDYRWRTLYVLGLSVLITCISVLIILTSERVSLC